MSPQPGFTPFIRQLGTGERRVLALHCTMAFSGAWAGMAKALGETTTLVAPDMPSHGSSADWDGNSDFSDTVFAAALAQLDEPMDIIGHSFGAAIALRLAVERPDLVRSLYLSEPVNFGVAAQDHPDLMDTHAQGFNEVFHALDCNEPSEAARQFHAIWGGVPSWDHLPQQIRAAMARAVVMVPNTNGFLFDDNRQIIPRLSQLSMPVTLLYGAQTHPLAIATQQGLAARIPHAQVHVVPNAGHMAPISHAQTCAEIWLKTIASSDAKDTK